MRHDGVAPVNEPCYVRDGDTCQGAYPVCCVTAGTCISQHSGSLSRTQANYEGGCQSLKSSRTEWSEEYQNAGCTQQGECMVQHLEVCRGVITSPGLMTELPQATMDRFMTGSCERECPKGRRGGGSYSRGGNGTTTTTTTAITRVTGSIQVTVSDVSAIGNSTALGRIVKRTIALFAGFGADEMLTIEMPSISKTMDIKFHFDVSNVDDVQHDEIRSNIAARSASQKNDLLALSIGTCSYTVTISGADDVQSSETSEFSSNARFVNSMLMALMATVAGILA